MFKKIERQNIDLLFTDTDSLCYTIRKQDIFQIIKENKEYFDLSDYPKEHELYDETNKKIIGKFKNESIKQITEFVGLRAKLYAFNTENIHTKNKKEEIIYDSERHMKCKGVKNVSLRKI